MNIRLLSKTVKIFFRILFLSIFLKNPIFSENLEISLPTKNLKLPCYITKVYAPASDYDWRYHEDLKQIIEFNFNSSGFVTVIEEQKKLEEALLWPEIRKNINQADWKKENVAYLFALYIHENLFRLEVININRQTSKKYDEIILSGDLVKDRQAIHVLCDRVQYDLFNVPGIASSQILYSKRTPSDAGWQSQIWICDADGSNHRLVISEDGYCVTPVFYPHNSHNFVYVSYKEGQSKIYCSSVDQSSGQKLLTLSGSQVLPTISKKGDMIAYISDVAGRPDLFVQNLDIFGKACGKPKQVFSLPRSTQASPTFSPDGKKLAFVSDKDGPPKIYVLDLVEFKKSKKTNAKLISKINRENTSPAWSPDGTKIAYSAKVDGTRQIWVYDLQKDEERAITFGSLNKENPAWAPDNLHLIYNTESNEECHLYRIRIDQKEPLQITKGIDQYRFGSWSGR